MILEELERGDETEPPVDEEDLDDLTGEFEAVDYPATGAEVVAAAGDREVASEEGTYAVADLVPETEAVTFDSPEAVRARIQRPTVAAAVKRIVEAADSVRDAELGASQRRAYERTLRELKAVDADDDDEGIDVVTDWIVERVDEEGKLPGSREVRKRAASFCRDRGYEIRNDEWLGA